MSERLIAILRNHTSAPKPITIYEASINRTFGKLTESLNLPHYRLHDLRHYYASTLLASGIPDKYAMELMGHSSNNTLKQVYQHLMSDKEDEFEKNLIAYQDKFF